MVHSVLATLAITLALSISKSTGSSSDWSNPNSPQYHIQTDEGNERYFRYQTISGQYRKEKRLEDGTVVGTYAWIDDDGFLRQRDYIADHEGYRILKTKNLYVGRDTPIAQAIKQAKKAPAAAGTLVSLKTPPSLPRVEISPNAIPSSTPAPPLVSSTLEPPTIGTQSPDYGAVDLNPWYYSAGQGGDSVAHNDKQYPFTFHNGPTYPIDTRGQTYTGNHLGNGYDQQYDLYDGVSVTNDGFRYYIPRAYHEEQNLGANRKSGSFGYVDPFGIRRVIYYNAAPGTGFQHRKNNRYVGLNATPYDPRPY